MSSIIVIILCVLLFLPSLHLLVCTDIWVAYSEVRCGFENYLMSVWIAWKVESPFLTTLLKIWQNIDVSTSKCDFKVI